MDEEGLLPKEREVRRRLDALGPDGRAELLRLLGLPSEERAAVTETLHSDPRQREIAELFIDIEEDLVARMIVIVELRIMNRQDG